MEADPDASAGRLSFLVDAIAEEFIHVVEDSRRDREIEEGIEAGRLTYSARISTSAEFSYPPWLGPTRDASTASPRPSTSPDESSAGVE